MTRVGTRLETSSPSSRSILRYERRWFPSAMNARSIRSSRTSITIVIGLESSMPPASNKLSFRDLSCGLEPGCNALVPRALCCVGTGMLSASNIQGNSYAATSCPCEIQSWTLWTYSFTCALSRPRLGVSGCFAAIVSDVYKRQRSRHGRSTSRTQDRHDCLRA